MPGSNQSHSGTDGLRPELRLARDELERLVLTEEFPAAVEAGEALLERSLSSDLESEVRFLLARAWVRLNDGARAYPYAHQARLLYEAAGDRLMAAETLVEEARAFYLLD